MLIAEDGNKHCQRGHNLGATVSCVFTTVSARKLSSQLQSNWVRICIIVDSCKTFFARSKRAFIHTHTHTHTLTHSFTQTSDEHEEEFLITEALIRALQVDVIDNCNIQNY
jgi:hypothetical protein